MSSSIDVQHACDNDIPAETSLQQWTDLALSAGQTPDAEVTLRFVSSQESQTLNAQFRSKDKPTNVLSFPFECPPGISLNLLGDLVICPDVVELEAEQQSKAINDHFAHMIMHGILHLLGYDHIDPEEADEMEALEIKLLAQLGIDDPYQDH
jgi:probable rRNA maturation factor